MSYFNNIFKRTNRRPTEFQLSTWENDGGFRSVFDDTVIINGRLCHGPLAKIRASLGRMIKNIKAAQTGDENARSDASAPVH